VLPSDLGPFNDQVRSGAMKSFGRRAVAAPAAAPADDHFERREPQTPSEGPVGLLGGSAQPIWGMVRRIRGHGSQESATPAPSGEEAILLPPSYNYGDEIRGIFVRRSSGEVLPSLSGLPGPPSSVASRPGSFASQSPLQKISPINEVRRRREAHAAHDRAVFEKRLSQGGLLRMQRQVRSPLRASRLLRLEGERGRIPDDEVGNLFPTGDEIVESKTFAPVRLTWAVPKPSAAMLMEVEARGC